MKYHTKTCADPPEMAILYEKSYKYHGEGGASDRCLSLERR